MPYKLRASLDNPYGPQVTFRTEDVLPPSAVYVSMQDTIVAQFQTNIGVSSLQLTLRLLLPDGTMQTETYYATQSTLHPIFWYVVIPPVEAYLLSGVAYGGLLGSGSAWCWCKVFRGDVPQPIISFPADGGLLLMQGYVNNQNHLAWPNSPIVEAGTGAGLMRSIALVAPTGTNWTQRVPTLTRWEILSVAFKLTTSAAAGNRQISLIVLDANGTGEMRFPVAFTQAPNLAYSYYFFSGAGNSQNAGPPVWNTAPIATPLLLDGSWSLQSSVQGLDAADSWTSPTMMVREWCGAGET